MKRWRETLFAIEVVVIAVITILNAIIMPAWQLYVWLF